jgi:rSAM/selenodomain-associated transferase 1
MAPRLMRTRIVIFAKAPMPGKVKTRLIPALGAEGAAELAQQMLGSTWAEAASVTVADREICVSPMPSDSDWQGRLPPGAIATAQGEGDLGERLSKASERVILEGQNVILIGTDCPSLTERRLREACWELESHDAVMHPTFDGGYALLGIKAFHPSLFSGISWSTDTVARETMGRIGALGWSLHLGATLQDIDEPEDLAAAGLA